MKCGLILFCTVVLYLNLVESIPDDYRNRAFHRAEWPNNQRVPHPSRNLLPYSPFNGPRTLQNIPPEKWPRNQLLHHQNQLNIAKHQHLNNLPLNYYSETSPQRSPQIPYQQSFPHQYGKLAKPQVLFADLRNVEDTPTVQRPNDRKITQTGTLESEGWWNIENLRKPFNNFAQPQSSNKEPQEETLPSDPRPNDKNLQTGNNIPSVGWWNSQILPQQHHNVAKLQNEPQSYEEIPVLVDDASAPEYSQVSTPSSRTNIPTDRWQFDQRLPQEQPSDFFERPYRFASNYPEIYGNQPVPNGNYPQGYSLYQTPASTYSNPTNDYPTYSQGWPTPVQYQDKPAPAQIGYQPWPANEYRNLIPNDPLYQYNINSEYERGMYPYNPLVDESVEAQVDRVPFSYDPVNQNNYTQIVLTHGTVNDSLNPYFKRYIIAHANGKYHSDDIEVDELNKADIKSKNVLHNELHIGEVEHKIPESKSDEHFELPFDVGISEFTQDTHWSHEDNSSTPNYKNLFALSSELTSDSDHDILNYFKPEYIMPIQYTTAKSIERTPYTKLPNMETNEPITDSNVLVETDTQNTPLTIDTLKLEQQIINGDINYYDTDYIYLEPSIEGTTPLEYDNQYYIPEAEHTDMVQPSTPEINTIGATTAYNNGHDDLTETTNSLPSPTLSYDIPKDLNIVKGIEGETTPFPVVPTASYPVLLDGGISLTTHPDLATDAPTTHKPTKLNDDLKIDASELITISKPVVWLRPDEQFWDKVTKGEKSFDTLAIYDVRCKPKLIEREATVHHYPNGTEIIELVETHWDHIGDKDPKDVKSERIVKHPDA